MEQLLTESKEFADVVIIDAPPFIVPDAMILASKVDGVLLAIRPGHTRRSLAKVSMDHIKLVGAKVVGVVLNRIPLRGADFYAGKSYAYTSNLGHYGDEGEGGEEKTDLDRLKETLAPHANQVNDFVKRLPYANQIGNAIKRSAFANKISDLMKNLFKAVFNLSTK